MSDRRVAQKVVLGAAIFNGKRQVLVVQRSKDLAVYPCAWELPSGKREFFESSYECLLREVREETGLDIEVIAPVSVFDYVIERPNETRDTTQVTFLARVSVDKPVVLSSEHQDHAWISLGRVEDYELSPETKVTVLRAFEMLDQHGTGSCTTNHPGVESLVEVHTMNAKLTKEERQMFKSLTEERLQRLRRELWEYESEGGNKAYVPKTARCIEVLDSLRKKVLATAGVQDGSVRH